MTQIKLKAIEEIENPERQIIEWGHRLIKSYRLTVEFEATENEFLWVLAGDNINKPCPEYDDDFEDFLVKVCGNKSFKMCRPFINEIQEKFSLAIHKVYSGSEVIDVQVPFTITQ